MYFIGNFQYLTNQQQGSEVERRHGFFSMMVQAASSQVALEKFRQRLDLFRQSSSLFEGQCTIYISQLLEFDQVPTQEAVMLNYRSYVGDPLLPHISCVVPTEQSNACTIHEWAKGHPRTEGHEDALFLQFS
ncbi:MAG: hypothetical protein M0036_06935 [Desulfobacteraceae bacterium]|nr:hypothetical protein [Desulfobacteraceae bacterium]